MIQNPYQGINAHFNSQLQNAGGWSSFHTVQIGDIAKLMNARLRPIGYTAQPEDGLQIRRIDMTKSQFRADVLVYNTESERPSSATASATGPGTQELVLPATAMLTASEIDSYKAIAVYEIELSTERGQPVVWLELLSPSNKVGRDLDVYQLKRSDLLQAGIVFVEIDYLHQTPPTFPGLPDYTHSHPDSYPYHITVIDPRPDIHEGVSRTRQFGVAEPIPTIRIPLSGEDALDFDFGAPYTKTFEEMLYGDDLDYDQLPAQFETYRKADQEAIRAVMASHKSD